MKAVIDLSSNTFPCIWHRSPAVQAYETRYFAMIVENWPGVIRWLEFLLIHTQVRTPGGTEAIVHLCCDLLDTILSSSTENVYKEELATRQCTIDLIYMILCQRERHTAHQYFYIPPLQARPGEGRCKIVKLFETAMGTQTVWNAMGERLMSIHRRTRDAIVWSLVARAEEIALRNPTFTIGVMDTLQSLVYAVSRITVNPWIRNAFRRVNYLASYAYALFALAERAEHSKVTDQKCWASIAKSAAMLSFCAENTSALTDLMEAGHYIACVVLCFRYQASPVELLKGLDNVLPYLYLSRAYHFANNQNKISSLLEPRRFSTEQESRIYREYARFLSHVRATHAQGSKLSVNLCSNMKVGRYRRRCRRLH